MANDKQTERIQQLAKKWQEGTITPEEKREFEEWYDTQDNAYELHTAEDKEETEQRIFEAILAKGNIVPAEQEPRIIKTTWTKVAVAASIVLALGLATFFITHKPQPTQEQVAQNHDIKPGTNQATLTLANGQKITLDKTLNGKIAQQGNSTITVNRGSNITYQNQNAANTNTPTTKQEIAYNTLSTARGQQSPYPLILSDGTKVWLNAASSITFPTAFNTNERKVTITGEAYVEVTHNAKQPFKVTVGNQTIEDIGTEFNINAYSDEPTIKTTLISGSIKVINNNTNKTSVTLKPGQQAINDNQNIKIQTVDLDGITAWKNNFFLFDDNNIEAIMRQIARWYDVDIKYETDAPKTRMLTGTITRYTNVSSVLRKIEITGTAHFKVNGKQIIVTN